MGAGDISKFLESIFPRYADYKEISKATKISKRNILKVLSSMRKRSEVEYIMVKSTARRGVWITKYRIRR